MIHTSTCYALDFFSLLSVLSLVCSILTLTLIACDRFFGIVFAMKAHFTERRARTCLVLVWFGALAVSWPLLQYRQQFKRHWMNHTEVSVTRSTRIRMSILKRSKWLTFCRRNFRKYSRVCFYSAYWYLSSVRSNRAYSYHNIYDIHIYIYRMS